MPSLTKRLTGTSRGEVIVSEGEKTWAITIVVAVCLTIIAHHLGKITKEIKVLGDGLERAIARGAYGIESQMEKKCSGQ